MSSFPACFGASAVSTIAGASYRIMTVSELLLHPPLSEKELLACVGRGDRVQVCQVLVVPDRRLQ